MKKEYMAPDIAIKEFMAESIVTTVSGTVPPETNADKAKKMLNDTNHLTELKWVF